ncbi:hypothetical protein COT97_03385 [Candidatus Falkowbacteria bacterium CG10_big_fil_rev_8_21_14_0_10_39_11]|uniref:Uncharacterized protein n=1 Tax=Candidatus Falkowbacteria bacterium CG10_big_fil_rev_8_21_14_0_10_39_11 TaxID=1974565 RepID=A0A2H0V4S4_9BACT|nr:MAG: hypothetical protein COT97_03385 [Candidatus Falkowbacteria bacterium CG10_big_fil_rev_8_21_14_0_10_39_11]
MSDKTIETINFINNHVLVFGLFLLLLELLMPGFVVYYINMNVFFVVSGVLKLIYWIYQY